MYGCTASTNASRDVALIVADGYSTRIAAQPSNICHTKQRRESKGRLQLISWQTKNLLDVVRAGIVNVHQEHQNFRGSRDSNNHGWYTRAGAVTLQLQCDNKGLELTEHYWYID